jgi:hypothetical protein
MPGWTILPFSDAHVPMDVRSAFQPTMRREAGQVGLCPLRTRLSDMKPRSDNAHRRHATGREIISEQVLGLHLKRIGVRQTA